MHKVKKTSIFCWRYALRPIIVLGLVSIVLFLAFLGRIAYKPLSLESYAPYVQEFLLPEGVSFSFDKLYLYFDGSLSLYADLPSFKYYDKEFLAKTARFEFSKRHTLTFRPAFKHIELQEPYLHIEVSDKPKSNKSKKPFSFESFINNNLQFPLDGSMSLVKSLDQEDSRFWKAMRTFRVNQGKVVVAYKDQEIQIDNLNADLIKHHFHGQSASVYMMLKLAKDSESKEISFSIKHEPKSDNLKVDFTAEEIDIAQILKLSNLEMSLGKDAKIAAAGQLTLNENNQIIDNKLILSGQHVKLPVEIAYHHPIKLEKLYTEVSLSPADKGSLKLDKIKVTDEQGLDISGYAYLKGLTDEVVLDADVDISSLDLNQAFYYIPSKIAGQTRKWLENHFTNSKTKEVNLRFNGPLLQFPFSGKEEESVGIFRIKTEIETAILSYMDQMPPIENINAYFLLENDVITADVISATTRGQVVNKGKVTLDQLYNEEPPLLSIETNVSGGIQNLLDLLSYIVPTSGFIGDVEGSHKGTFNISIPLKSEIYYKDIKFNAKGDLLNAGLVPPYIGALFKSENSQIYVDQDRLELKGKGYLNTQPVDVVWKEDINNFGDKTFIEVISDVDQATLEKTFEQVMPFNLKGTSLAKLTLENAGNKKFDYKLFADLTAGELSLNDLNWTKPKGQKSFVESHGKLRVDGQRIWIDHLLLRAPETDVKGTAIVDLTSGKSSEFKFDPVKMGSSDFKVSFKEDDSFILTGKSLDLRLLSQKKGTGDSYLLFENKGIVKLELDQILTAGGKLTDVTLNAEKKSGFWESAQADMQTERKHKAHFTLKRVAEESRQIEAHAENAGDFLRALDFYPNLRDGVLDAQLNLQDVRDPNDKEALTRGNGYLEMTNAHVVKAPILAKIMSLLSLEQIANLDKGIIFDKISLPLQLKNKVLISKDAKLEGPSMALKAQALVNFAAHKIDVEGTLVPISNLNKAVDSIPVVGNLLTGSQDSLFAAEFSFSGDMDNPKVSVNPLSAVTPGIIKDLVGVLNKYGAISQDKYKDWDLNDE